MLKWERNRGQNENEIVKRDENNKKIRIDKMKEFNISSIQSCDLNYIPSNCDSEGVNTHKTDTCVADPIQQSSHTLTHT